MANHKLAATDEGHGYPKWAKLPLILAELGMTEMPPWPDQSQPLLTDSCFHFQCVSCEQENVRKVHGALTSPPVMCRQHAIQ